MLDSFERLSGVLVARFPAGLLLVAGGLGTPLAAQAAGDAGPLADVYQPAGHYRLTLATGAITPEPFELDAPEGGSCSNTIINVLVNIDASTLFYTAPVSTTEWVDWGVTTNVTAGDIVPEFTFGYASYELDKSIGGPGATIGLRFYEGYLGPCNPGDPLMATEIASFVLTGLPAETVPGSSTAKGYFLTLDLRGGNEFLLQAGPVGFGYFNPNAEATGIIQSYAGNPSGSQTNPDSQGQVTALDEWIPGAPTGTCNGSLILNQDTTGTLVGSHYLLLRKANAPATPPAEAFVRNDLGNQNPIALLAAGTPVINQSFTLIGTATAPGDVGMFLAGFGAPTELTTPFGVLLVDFLHPGGELLGSSGLNGPHVFSNGFVAVTSFLPPNVELCGFDLFVQAGIFGTGVRLTNAVDLTFGLR